MQIIVAPDSRLNQISKKVEIVDDSIISTLDQMLECMYQNNGIGLAAPQVGILKRLVVIDCNDNKDTKKPLKLINPEITELSKNISEFEEGCLSLPSQYAKVIRPSEITLKYTNIEGLICESKFSGLEATCIQHEIDHLDGKLFVDHISKLKKNLIIKKLKKLKKKI
ncbi:peptide deformylase [Alphaproteobacteria bacterium]|nr:peptide deformylase [Alphaproteobacteria bacterium]